MHHNPAKNVLYVRAPVEEIARRMNLAPERVKDCWRRRRRRCMRRGCSVLLRMSTRRCMSGWNSLCVSAYLEAAKVLDLAEARRFALRSLDRVLGEAWRQHAEARARTPAATRAGHTALLLHVVSYSDPEAAHREVPGMLDDYAFTALACLDAYEATADLSYFKFAQSIADAMIARFFDATSGGFFDSEPAADGKSLGVLATRRKPLQDSPTPAGNPMAAIALAAAASLHGRFQLSRQSGADARNVCRRGRTVRNFRRDLRDCRRPFAGESRAGCSDCGG